MTNIDVDAHRGDIVPRGLPKQVATHLASGADVGDLFMSLIRTCELCGPNAFDYLTEPQRNAVELARQPRQSMPWNYSDSLAQLDTVA